IGAVRRRDDLGQVRRLHHGAARRRTGRCPDQAPRSCPVPPGSELNEIERIENCKVHICNLNFAIFHLQFCLPSRRRSSRGCLMQAPPRPESGSVRTEDERLIHALVSRGLISREEAQQCRAGQTLGARKLLALLVECGSLTSSQAARAEQELTLLL